MDRHLGEGSSAASSNRKPRTWRILTVVAMLAAALVGCRCISVHYYGIAKARLFEMYVGIRLGMTVREACDFCERNEVLGMSIIREEGDRKVIVTLNFILATLGGKSPEGMWDLNLYFDGGRLVRAMVWDVGGERGARIKRIGPERTTIYEDRPPKY